MLTKAMFDCLSRVIVPDNFMEWALDAQVKELRKIFKATKNYFAATCSDKQLDCFIRLIKGEVFPAFSWRKAHPPGTIDSFTNPDYEPSWFDEYNKMVEVPALLEYSDSMDVVAISAAVLTVLNQGGYENFPALQVDATLQCLVEIVKQMLPLHRPDWYASSVVNTASILQISAEQEAEHLAKKRVVSNEQREQRRRAEKEVVETLKNSLVTKLAASAYFNQLIKTRLEGGFHVSMEMSGKYTDLDMAKLAELSGESTPESFLIDRDILTGFINEALFESKPEWFRQSKTGLFFKKQFNEKPTKEECQCRRRLNKLKDKFGDKLLAKSIIVVLGGTHECAKEASQAVEEGTRPAEALATA